ncbi:hypothetical protein [Clostridium beijerinckii]|uniref:Uncharacterized protein n=1 Tax=Clostridium beijerinckii TaxID=1520 RepID=A0AAE5H8T6_CLOBE|nr:hypothetical protein [Clostridium beijerinckii]NSB17456.1 hypothetical protein [Clostridium beijerinckii]OOM28433.1 hypothetical protein CLOBE_26890 [Clostridium beijerinckii]
MVKTVTNKNIDEVLFGQLKAINFEYLVQLNGLLEDYTFEFGADVLDEELVKFDITLNSVIRERIEELIEGEAKVKEIIAESRKEDNKVKYVKEAREYLESLHDIFGWEKADDECLDIVERLKKHIYELGSLETQVDVLKSLLITPIEETETVKRAKLAGYLAINEVIRKVKQEELDKNREYINSIKIEDTEEIRFLIEGYELNGNMDFTHWFMLNKYGLAHINEVFLSEYIEDNVMHIVFQNSKDLDCSEPYCLK